MIDIKFFTFKNKNYAYLYNTQFLIQVSENGNGLYETKHYLSGDMKKAVEIYSNLKPEPKHRKRIVMVGNIGETVVDVEKY